MAGFQEFPIEENIETGQRQQWNGTTWLDLPNAKAAGAAYLPQGRTATPSPSAEAGFRKYQEGQLASVAQARDATAQSRRVEGLLANQETGGMYAVPILGDIAGAFDPEIRELNAWSSASARAKRTPGEGATSDFDAKMFLAQAPGKDKPTATNKALLRADRLRADQTIQRQEMADWWHQNYGAIDGFEEAWSRYRDANEIFDRRSEQLGRPILNEKRRNWREYYGAVRGPMDARPSAPLQDMQQEQFRGEKARLKQSTTPLDTGQLSAAAQKTVSLMRGSKQPSGTPSNPWVPVSQSDMNWLKKNAAGSSFINPATGKVLTVGGE